MAERARPDAPGETWCSKCGMDTTHSTRTDTDGALSRTCWRCGISWYRPAPPAEPRPDVPGQCVWTYDGMDGQIKVCRATEPEHGVRGYLHPYAPPAERADHAAWCIVGDCHCHLRPAPPAEQALTRWGCHSCGIQSPLRTDEQAETAYREHRETHHAERAEPRCADPTPHEPHLRSTELGRCSGVAGRAEPRTNTIGSHPEISTDNPAADVRAFLAADAERAEPPQPLTRERLRAVQRQAIEDAPDEATVYEMRERALDAVLSALDAEIERIPHDEATTGRDFGRGVAHHNAAVRGLLARLRGER